LNLLPGITGRRKGCCFAGQIALFRKMAAVPEGLPMQGLQQPDRSAKVQLLTKTSTRRAFQRNEWLEARHNIQELWFL
jgi:hypothetical protein